MRNLFALFATLFAILSFPAFAASDKFITIGTADELGVYYPTGGAICRLVKRGTKDHGIRCFVEPTEGSIENLEGIRIRKIDLGIAQTDWVYNAYNGAEAFDGEYSNPKLRTVLSLHMEAFTVLVRDDSPIQQFTQLKGKRINIGNQGSGVRATMERIMKIEGWSKRSFKQVSEMKLQDQGKALCAGQIDAIIYIAGHPNGAINEVSNLCKTRILSVEGPEIDALIKQYPFYYKALIPAGMYRGNETAVSTIATKALLVVSSDLDESIVYEVVKAIMDNLDNFKTLHPVFSMLNEKSMSSEGFVAPVHAGSLRYFKEKSALTKTP